MPATTHSSTNVRKRRYERADEAPSFQLTERDAEIVLAIGRNRFLNSRQIQALVPGSSDKILRRLNGLFHAGYIDRPRAQIDYYSSVGSAPMVYAL